MKFYISSMYQEMLGATIMFLPQFLSGLLIFLFFCVLYMLAGRIFKKLLSDKDGENKVLIKFFRKLTRIFLLIFGFITMLGTWGVDVSAIVMGIGLAGFFIAVALKDVLSSILAGIMILVYKPFAVGDIISICDSEGRVTAIDLRYTTIGSKGDKHLIPNSKFVLEKATVLKE